MSDFLLNSEGDLSVTLGRAVVVQGQDALLQQASIRLKLFRGEWFRDLRIGMPYREHVLVKNPSRNVLRAVFRRALQSLPGVASVSALSVQIDANRRSLSVTADLRQQADLDVARLEFSGPIFELPAPPEAS